MIFLCFRLSASVKWAFFQRGRGKENETDHENTKSDSPDRRTELQMMLKLVHSGFSGIQTRDICLVTGSHNLPKSAIFKTFKERICLMIADRYWLDVSSQFQGLSKEMKAAIGFPTAPQSEWIVITYSVFQEVFHLGQRRLAVLWQPWTSISSDLQ